MQGTKEEAGPFAGWRSTVLFIWQKVVVVGTGDIAGGRWFD
jgi:hypothetical protein